MKKEKQVSEYIRKSGFYEEDNQVRIRKFSLRARKIIMWFILSSIFFVIIIFILFGVL